MPIIVTGQVTTGDFIATRRLLRQRLGMNNLHDTLVSTHIGSLPANTGSVFFIDVLQADSSATNEQRFSRAWIKTQDMKFRLASFNTMSGAYVTGQMCATTILSGSEYEVHELVDPDDKDRAIDWTVSRLWMRQEVAVNTVDGALTMSVGVEFGQVFDWWLLSNPTATMDRGRTAFSGKPQVRLTGSGRMLQLPFALQGSQQIILDAELRLTLGTNDAATVNLPDERLILYGAEAQCWEMLAKRAPAQERKAYLLNAQRAAGAFSRLATRFAPQTDKPLGFLEFN